MRRVDQMAGMGRRMPWTMAAFTVAALGMIGVPLLAGFFSKWYIGWGALTSGQPWILAILVASTILNAVYFLPMIYRSWFMEAPSPSPRERTAAQAIYRRGGHEANGMLLIPSLFTALLVLLAGILANAPWSLLSWAAIITAGGFK